MLSALTAYRSRLHLSKQTHALAFVIGEFMIRPWAHIYSAAYERATRLGFDLQRYIWRNDVCHERQSDVLRARGIKGVTIGPLNTLSRQFPLPLNPSHFCLVAIGRFLSGTNLNDDTRRFTHPGRGLRR